MAYIRIVELDVSGDIASITLNTEDRNLYDKVKALIKCEVSSNTNPFDIILDYRHLNEDIIAMLGLKTNLDGLILSNKSFVRIKNTDIIFDHMLIPRIQEHRGNNILIYNGGRYIEVNQVCFKRIKSLLGML